MFLRTYTVLCIKIPIRCKSSHWRQRPVPFPFFLEITIRPILGRRHPRELYLKYQLSLPKFCPDGTKYPLCSPGTEPDSPRRIFRSIRSPRTPRLYRRRLSILPSTSFQMCFISGAVPTNWSTDKNQGIGISQRQNLWIPYR